MAQRMHTPRPVLVIDFGAQYAQLITRRVREAHVYSELLSSTSSLDDIRAKKPVAVILSGGPASVYMPDAPRIDSELFALGIPIFGICYGFQLIAQHLGGTVVKTGLREFGRAQLETVDGSALFKDLPVRQTVWMSHGDHVSKVPEGVTVSAGSEGAPIAAFENISRRCAGVQFHPEELHTTHGQAILEHFLYDIAGIKPSWTTASIIDEQVAAIQAQVEKDYVAATGVKLKVVDVAAHFLKALKDVTDPEQKRKIIGREFIRTFEKSG